MFENNVKVISMARAMAAHAAARQAAVAQNVAQADTQGYQPRDLPAFADIVGAAGTPLRATRPGHTGWAAATTLRAQPEGGGTAPNGNGVSLERELVRAAEVRLQHDLALVIQTRLSGALRAALGRGR